MAIIDAPELDPDVESSIAGRIRQEREALGLSNEAFAERSHIDIDRLNELEEDRPGVDSIQIDELARMVLSGADANYIVLGLRRPWQPTSKARNTDKKNADDSDKENIDTGFMTRMNWVLGDRQKHPWGRSIGLKNSRIVSIFDGVMPQADALLMIRRAEKVNIDWLLTGEGQPTVRREDAEQEERLLRHFRMLPAHQREAVLGVVEGLDRTA